MRRLWIGLVVMAVACTQAQPANFPNATPSPPVSGSLLFAALEAKGTANLLEWNTVAIAGLDGYAKAKTTFTPMPTPYVGCAGAVLPMSALVAAGKVYFADGTGAVRSLSAQGQLTPVTTFPLTSRQQMLSFAVSPDGSRLLATIFTIPPRSPSGNCSDPAAPTFAPGEFGLDVFSARAGGAGRLLYHETLAPTTESPLPNVMALVGWDHVGPFGTYPTGWATQGGGPVRYRGIPVRIDANTGKVVSPISDPQSCSVSDIVPSGDFVCTQLGGGAISVRRPDGGEVWHFASQPPNGYFFAFLGPDEQHVVAANAGSEVVGRDGTRVKLPDAFSHNGWLDSATVVGGGVDADLTYVSLKAPGTVVDVGFKGLFVGTVQT